MATRSLWHVLVDYIFQPLWLLILAQKDLTYLAKIKLQAQLHALLFSLALQNIEVAGPTRSALFKMGNSWVASQFPLGLMRVLK